MTPAPRLGLLGGTFDPVHVGHVAAAHAARRALALDRVLFVPSHDPPHRTAVPNASRFHRFAMVALAISNEPGLHVSDLELQKDGPSYTADTLRELHARGCRPVELFFITGADAFVEIASWHEYPTVLDLANFVVVARPGTTLAAVCERLPNLAPRMRAVSGVGQGGVPERLAETAILLVEARTPDVSSTDVRRRLRESLPVSGLLAPAVERHVRRHGLYGALA